MESSVDSDPAPALADSHTVFSQVKSEDEQLTLKRRWLMGLPLSQRERNLFEGPEFLKANTLPESLLREDDIFFETAKGRVEEAYFGEPPSAQSHDRSRLPDRDFEPFDMPKTVRHLLSRLSDLTSRGLYNFAMVLAGGSVEVPKTRLRLRKIVNESLAKVLSKHRSCDCELCKQIYSLLCDPCNFRGNNPILSAPEARPGKAAAVISLLDRLGSLHFPVLVAMYRELKGKPAGSRCGRSRDFLVRQVRKTSTDMLSKLKEEETLPEPLAKAMTIAVLSTRLTSGPQSFSSTTAFHEISPEMKTVQDDIVRAIMLLGTKEFKPQELERLRLLLDPKAKTSSGYIKPSVKKMLTEYLFESCDTDMDAIPRSILEGVAFINHSSHTENGASFSKDELEEEVECLMELSAQTKQIAWDFLPANEYHDGFADAYMEELVESEDDDDDDDVASDEDGNGIKKDDSSEANLLIEGFGESILGESPIVHDKENTASSRLVTASKLVTPRSERELFTDFKLSEGRTSIKMEGSSLLSPKKEESDGNAFAASHISCSSKSSERHKVEDQNNYRSSQRNQYTAIQDACDETSMVAYNVVGFMLEELAKAEGVELDAREGFYLKGESSVEEDPHSVARNKKENVEGSVIYQAVRKLLIQSGSIQKSSQ